MENSPLKWIYKEVRKYIGAIILLSLLSGAIALSFIQLALVSRQVIDIATGDGTGSILKQCLYLALLIGFQALCNILVSNLRVRTQGKLDMSLKQKLFHQLLRKQYLEVNQYHSGELLNRLTSDIDIVVNGVISIVPQAISLSTKLIAGITVLFLMDPKFTVFIGSIGLLVVLCSRLYRDQYKALHKACQGTDGVRRSFLQESLGNLMVVKAFQSEEYAGKKLLEYQMDHYKATVKRNTVSNIANTSVYVLFTVSYYAALAWGALQLSRNTMTFGTLTAFLQIIEQVKAPFRNMSGLIPQYYATIASIERLQELEVLQDDISQPGISLQKIYEDMDGILIENLCFSYQEEAVFDHASCRIEKGEFVFLVGESGAGKSTLIKLLLALLYPQEGKLSLMTTRGEIGINADTRAMFTYVPQGNMILSGTIGENIRFGREEARDAEVMEAAEIACIGELIRSLPLGLDTVVGERGFGLSEGQVQRLAIARAILSQSPILLFDECTSALDKDTEAQVLYNLEQLHDRTKLFITHRAITSNVNGKILRLRERKMWEEKVHE